MRIGVLTGGGDCPGLNAAIRSIVRLAAHGGDEILGIHHGWRGMVDHEIAPLNESTTAQILQSGGTILHSDRHHPDLHAGATEIVLETIRRESIDALIVIGGDGTLSAASRLAELGVPVNGIPKTIDNDIAGSEESIGFATAVATAAEAIDRVHTTGESHDRLMVVEVMGRSTGWLAACAGLAAGADFICLPEHPTDISALAAAVIRRHDRGATSSVIVVAEGATLIDSATPSLSAHGGDLSPGARVTAELGGRTGYESRLTVLGHIQRGGPM